MAKSSTLISLTSNPTDGETFTILSDNTTSIIITFRNSPTLLGDVLIGLITSETNLNLNDTINSTYNTLSEYTVTIPTGSSINVESTVDNTVFTKVDVGFTNGTLAVTNEVVLIPINILSINYLGDEQISSQCDDIVAGVSSDININEYSIDGAPNVVISATTYAFITLPRESDISLEVFNTEQASDVSDTGTTKTALKLSNLKNYVTWESVYFPDGSTLTINLDPSPPYPYVGFDYLYELGIGNGYQISNIFTGLSSGLQGSLGFKEGGDTLCEDQDSIDGITILETVPPTSVTSPYFKVSESNSLTLEYVEQYNNKSVYKNLFNSKSCQSDNQIPEAINQVYLEDDKVPTQFRSNYENNIVKGISLDGSELAISTELILQNIGLKDSRDSTYYNFGNNQIGIYFTSGDVYDYDSTTVTGTYDLDGFLPEWGVIGNYAFVYELGGWLEIKNIIFDDSRSADVLVFDYIYLGLDAPTRVSSLYNREIYDVYSFPTNMFNFKGNTFNLSIESSDSRDLWTDLSLSSENITVESYDNDFIELIYFDYQNNSDMEYFDLDFYNLLRLPYELFYGGSDSEKEVEKTDNTAITLSTKNYHIKTLSLKSLPSMYMRKLSQAFSHKEIFLNRIQYTVEDVEISDVIGNTNTHDIEVKLIDAENGFNPLIDRTYAGNIKINKTLAELFKEKAELEGGIVVSEECIINYPY